MEQNAYLNFLEKEAKQKRHLKVFKEKQASKQQADMKQNKQTKNLYLQNIIEAYNPYNNLNASCYELQERKETI